MSKILKKYKAHIFGEIYTIVSDEDDALVLEVVGKVDSMMKELATNASLTHDAKRIAVLVALKATQDLVLAQQLIQQDEIACQKIINLLENQNEITL